VSSPEFWASWPHALRELAVACSTLIRSLRSLWTWPWSSDAFSAKLLLLVLADRHRDREALDLLSARRPAASRASASACFWRSASAFLSSRSRWSWASWLRVSERLLGLRLVP
jgi:hypothetical protein